MKRILILTIIGTIFLTTAFLSVKAAGYDFNKNSGIQDTGSKAGFQTSSTTGPEYYIGNILTLMFSMLGLVFLILTVYAGVNWMTAQGNSSQVEKSKDTLIRSIVGLMIVIAAYGITVFIMSTFNRKDQSIIDSSVTSPSEPQNGYSA